METTAKITPTFKDNLAANGGMGWWAYSGPTLPVPQAPAEPAPEANKEPQELQVALIGTAPSSRLLAPFTDNSWKIWACSPGNMTGLPKADAWFEIHGNLLWDEHKSYGEPYLKWLSEQKIPVYMQITKGFDARKHVPNALRFPWVELVQEFGRDFFTSSFAWMIAFALKSGAKKIAMYGIDMASPGEYHTQRASFYFWRHEAKRRGAEIVAPFESDIMQSPGLYGFAECTPRGRKILARKRELQGRISALQQQYAQIGHNIQHLQGALEDNDYYETIWIDEVIDPYGIAELEERPNG